MGWRDVRPGAILAYLGMSRTGLAHLPLHTGRAPPWLFQRMVPLAREIVSHVVAEYVRSRC